MNCNEFKNSVREYLRGGLSSAERSEFREHLLSCEYCKKDIGEEIARYIEEEQADPKRAGRQRYTLYFILFMLFAFLIVVIIQYLKLKEYKPEDATPILEAPRSNLIEPASWNKSKKGQRKAEESSARDYMLTDYGKDAGAEGYPEDFSIYSRSELLSRMEDCKKKGDYRCISQASMQLAKMSSGENRRRFRLMAIEALVEMGSCSAAMLNIMMLFKEDPDKKEIHRSHLLNAKCYIKEKNFSEARKILDMIEGDATELRDEIHSLRSEIEKGERDGE